MDYFLNIPNKVDKILRILGREGFDAYVVGGCVRDILMGRKPSDWDVTTSATPEETKACFSGYKVIETGIKHGTVTVVMDGEPFEITTFRSDGAYSDGRHPDSVSFSKDIKVDLARRDFTMNALAYSPNKGLVDEYGGLADIKNRIIKAVGVPEERFGEDSLRILRAIRFAGTLGFMLDPGTARAVKALAATAGRASAERIMTELNKLFMGAYAAYAVKVYRNEINEAISFSGARIMDRKAVRSLEHAPASLPLRLALLLDVPDDGEQLQMPIGDGSGSTRMPNSGRSSGLFGSGGLLAFAGDLFGAVPDTDIDAFRGALRKMKYDNDTIKQASAIKEASAKNIEPEEPVVLLEMRKLADSFPYEEVPDILMDGISVRSLKGKLSDSGTEKLFGIIGGIVEQGRCYSRSQLEVTGDDLIGDKELADTGLKPGKDVGRILSALLDEVIAGQLENKKNRLLERARSLYSVLNC
ncbi:MAG: hypothetical protein IJH41_06220 [Eubacterium sp.]|nr:hypothetical protein [Eubacterium sp.]